MAEEKQNVGGNEDVASFADIMKDTDFEVKQISAAEKAKEYDQDLAKETKKFLATEMEINGHRTTPAKVIVQGMIGHVMENPTPINVKTMQDVVGDSTIKVDVGGMGIEKFIESVKAGD